jgi:hypothetical protein
MSQKAGLFSLVSTYGGMGSFMTLTCFIFRYSEFRNIPSRPFLPLADADRARKADLLNSEYSCKSTWRQRQK